MNHQRVNKSDRKDWCVMGYSIDRAKNMIMSLLVYVRTLYPFPYVGGCPDIGKISTFSGITIHT